MREWAAHSDPKAFLKCLVVVHAKEHDEVWAGLPLQNEIRIFHAEVRSFVFPPFVFALPLRQRA